MSNELTPYASLIKEIKELIYHRQYEGKSNLPPSVGEIVTEKTAINGGRNQEGSFL